MAQPAARLAVFDDREAASTPSAAPSAAPAENMLGNRSGSKRKPLRQSEGAETVKADKGGLLQLDSLLGGMPTLVNTTTSGLSQSSHHESQPFIAVPVYDTSRSFGLGIGGGEATVTVGDIPAVVSSKNPKPGSGSVPQSTLDNVAQEASLGGGRSTSETGAEGTGRKGGGAENGPSSTKAASTCQKRKAKDDPSLGLPSRSDVEGADDAFRNVNKRSCSTAGSLTSPQVVAGGLPVTSFNHRMRKEVEPTFVRVGSAKLQQSSSKPPSRNQAKPAAGKGPSQVAAAGGQSTAGGGSLADSLDDIMGMLLGS